MQRTLSNMNYIIIVIDTHMNLCKNPCHVFVCTSAHVYIVQGWDLWKLLNDCCCSQEKGQNFLDLQFTKLCNFENWNWFKFAAKNGEFPQNCDPLRIILKISAFHILEAEC